MRALPILEPRRVASATYETLAMLLDASEVITGDRVRPQLEKKTDAVAILLRDRALVLLGSRSAGAARSWRASTSSTSSGAPKVSSSRSRSPRRTCRASPK